MKKANKLSAAAVAVIAPVVGRPRNAREEVFTQLMKDYTAASRRARDYVERLATAFEVGAAAELAHQMEVVYALNAVDTMAEAAVFQEVVRGLWTAENNGRPCSLENLRATVYRETMRRARNGSRSTSVLTNKMETARLAAWSCILEVIDANPGERPWGAAEER